MKFIFLLSVLLTLQHRFAFSQNIKWDTANIESDTLFPKKSLGVSLSLLDKWSHPTPANAPPIEQHKKFALAPLCFTFQYPIGKSLFINSGIIFPTKESGLYWNALTVKTGLTWKLWVSPKFYFVPSVNIYEYFVFKKLDNYYSKWAIPKNVISFGTDIEFEYNPNKAFSYVICLGELSYGLVSGGDFPFSIVQLHSLLGIGIHYNFPRQVRKK